MEIPKYKTALIVGAGEGLSARWRGCSRAKASGSRSPHARSKSSARSAPKPAPAPLPAMPPMPTTSNGCSAWSSARSAPRHRRLQRQRTGARRLHRSGARRCRAARSRSRAFGGFLVAQQAAKRMLPNKHGAILFTGASASVKGYAQSAPFAMGKFALRGLAQSMARELSPQGIHVAHFVIDGGIRSAARAEPADSRTRCSIPTPLRRATGMCCNSRAAPGPGKLELRPWVEKF